MWVGGLKQRDSEIQIQIQRVASYVGAWIETRARSVLMLVPYTSHPMWVRGLKLKELVYSIWEGAVASYVGAWIETAQDTYACTSHMSHPMWVRGLKRKSF